MRLWSRASPWTRERQSATLSRRGAGTGRNTGQRLMAAAKKSKTLMGQLRSKLGLWGT